MAANDIEKCSGDDKRCCRKANINNLWSVWYCIVVVGLEVYLLTTNIQNFVRYIELPWPEDADPRFELNTFIGLIGASVLLIPLFMVTSILRVGNLPNDGHKLGIGESGDPELLLPDYYISKSITSKFRRIWRHCGPTAPLLHIFSAICLLLPKLLIQAKLIKHGFLSLDDMWKTDLDFMIMHKDRLVVFHFLTTLNSSYVLSKEVGLNSRMLVHQNIPDIQLQELSPVSPEFINFALALLVYAIRYPSVFWHTSRSFGLIFSAQMVFGAGQTLLAFAGFTVLYNVHIVGPQNSLLIYDSDFLLGSKSSVALFVTYCLLLVCFGCVVYFYGYLKYREHAAQQSRKNHITLLDPEYKNKCCGYVPHIMAFILLCLTSMCAGPLMYDFIMVYQGSLDGAVLAGVIGTVFHLLFWVLLWLGLTLKQDWMFRLLISGSQSKLSDPASLIKIAHEIEMTNLGPSKDNAPLLVIADGQAFTVRESTSKNLIISAAKKATEPPKTEEEDIYWLKPHAAVPKPAKSVDSIQSKRSWLSRKGRSNSFKGSKVSFDDSSMMGDDRPYTKSSKSPKSKSKRQLRRVDSDSDDGDYATLKADLPRVQEVDEEEMIDEYTPLSPEDNEEDYVDYDYLSETYPVPQRLTAPVTVHNNSYDSGMPIHCDSVSDASSVTPPDKANGSETSSSGHFSMSDKRASSFEDLHGMPCSPTHRVKSMSLQRNVPTSLPLNSANMQNSGGNPNIVVLNTLYNNTKNQLYSDPREVPPSTMVIKPRGSRPLSGGGSGEKFGRCTNAHLSSFSEEPEYTAVRKKFQQNIHKRKHPGSAPIGHRLNDLNQSPTKSTNKNAQRNASAQRRDLNNLPLYAMKS